MRALIVATNSTQPNIEEKVQLGQHQRVDYLDLGQRLNADYLDYNQVKENKLARRVEDKLRMDAQQALEVARRVKRYGYDVVFSMSERVAIPLSYMLDRKVRHVVIAVHPLSAKKLKLLKALKVPYRWDTIIVHSQAEVERLTEILGVKPGRVVALHNSVDPEFYRPDLSVAPQDYILSLGLSYRDYPTLLKAMRTLPQITSQIRAGSAWVNNQAGYENETIPSNVLPKAPLPSDQLRACYNECRFVVLPIRPTTQWSAGSTVSLEAQAMGKAVIATRTPGMGDYVRDGDTGILVEQGNPKALAEAIEYLWNNPEIASAMGQRGREWVKATYSIDRWLDRAAEIIQNQVLSRELIWAK